MYIASSISQIYDNNKASARRNSAAITIYLVQVNFRVQRRKVYHKTEQIRGKISKSMDILD